MKCRINSKKECGQDAVRDYKDFVYDVHINVRDDSDMKSLEKVCGIKTWLCDECGTNIKGTIMPKLGDIAVCEKCIEEDKLS